MSYCSGIFSLRFMVLVVLTLVWVSEAQQAHLSYDHYELSCPNVETIVKDAILPMFLSDLTTPAALLRLMFHDCQVQGCDASILLDSGYEDGNAEMGSSRNFKIRKREVITVIKSVLEMECPGQISCADIVALAAKEAVAFTGGPQIQIPLGRRDSTSSSYKQADISLPPPQMTVDEMLQMFISKGMDIEESVAILGAHTLGVGHCLNIVDRLYNRKPSYKDNIDGHYENLLRFKCPTKVPLNNLTFVVNDLTPSKFDNQYFQDILIGKGLFGIDSRISRDTRTEIIVKRFAADETYFFQVFSSAFVKLSSSNVLTGQSGQIRWDCSIVN